MTGSQIGAENGTLTLMCGGRPDAVEAARPVMEAYSQRIVHVGKPGSGQIAKMANQICIAGNVAALAEAVRFAQASHLDMDKRSDEHTSELQSLMRNSYAVFCLKTKTHKKTNIQSNKTTT